jgi:hypothetical protein
MKEGLTLKKIFIPLLCVLLFFSPLFATSMDEELFGSSDSSFEEDLFGSESDDDLFGESSGDSFITQVEETDKSLQTILLTQDEGGVRVGGSFSFNGTPGFTWYPSEEEVDATFSGSIDSELFIDARMSEDTRVYSSFGITYPFVSPDSNPTEPTYSLKELFADITYNDSLFFRIGKQTINWGVGYFFSPADLLNLSDIDPLNTSGDLEGPIAIKLNAPIGVDNLYAYIISPPTLTDASDLAYAVKLEKVINKTEVGFGAYYRYDNPPAAMLTFSSGLGQIAMFGEAVLQYGSNKTFITEYTSPYKTTTYKDKFFFLGTIGGNYTYTAPASDFAFSIAAQYFFNGEGYNNTDFYDAVIPLLFSEDITIKDLNNPGMHYAALTTSFSFNTHIGTSVTALSNLSDGSGIIIPRITYTGIKNLTVSLDTRFTFGKDGTEYTQNMSSIGDSAWSISPSVSISFGILNF